MSAVPVFVPDDLSEAEIKTIFTKKYGELPPVTGLAIAPLFLTWLEHHPESLIYHPMNSPIPAVVDALYGKYSAVLDACAHEYWDHINKMILSVKAPTLTQIKKAVWQHIEFTFPKAISLLLSDIQWRDRVIGVLQTTTHRMSYLAPLDTMPIEHSLMRRSDLTLFKPAEVSRLLDSQQNILSVLLSVAKTCDFEAFALLKKSKRIARHMDGKTLLEYASKHKQPLPNAFLQFLARPEAGADYPTQPAAQKLDIVRWTSMFIGALEQSVESLMQDMYCPESAKQAGHELIFALFKRGGALRRGDEELIQRLVKDGADWYLGLKQHQVGSFAYLGLRDRTPCPAQEFTELVDAGMAKAMGPMVGAIIDALGEDLVMAYATTTQKADRVYRIVPLPYLRNCISPKVLTKSLEADLGL